MESTNQCTQVSLTSEQDAGISSNAAISDILEDRNGTLWFGSTAGLLKFNRAHDRILRYHNNPFDSESLEEDRVIYLCQDQEGKIWTCFRAYELLHEKAYFLDQAPGCDDDAFGEVQISAGVRFRGQRPGIAKFTLDIDRKSTTIWLWIDWVQHLRLWLIQPGGR
jgi:hypothetical protein